jgi:signal transduction histidine kinase
MLSPLTGLILIVDDRPTNLEVICETLVAVGLTVAIATSGERALQQIDREQPDLILLDIMMPGLDGFATCQRLKANPATSDIPIIFMTALADTDSKVKALDLGAVDYVTKPFQVQEVLARVRTHLQLTRLAAAAQQTAIAHEREQAAKARFEELEKANEAMRRSVERLADAENIHVVLDAFLLEAFVVTQADIGVVMDRLAGTEFRMRSLALGGEIMTLPETEPLAIAMRSVSARDPVGVFRQLVEGQVHCQPVDDHFAAWFPEGAAFHRQRGDQMIWFLPIKFRQTIIGCLIVAFINPQGLDRVMNETLQALTHQLSLALEMLRLSEAAKQAAILDERNRMARDIHDSLAQSFTGIIMQVEALKTAPVIDLDEIRTALARVGDLARLGLAEARRSVQALRPAALETAHFSEALRLLLDQITEGTAIQPHLDVQGLPTPLPAPIEENLLRIAQEAMTNAIRHSRAQTLTLQLLFELTAIHLRIMDDGEGLGPGGDRVTGFGIIGMQERAANLGGQFYLVSQPGQGTEITVTVPIGG